MITYVKQTLSDEPTRVLAYNDITDINDPAFEAEYVTDTYDGDINSLPEFDSVGQPWYSEPVVQTMPTEQYGTTAERPTLGAHEFYTRYNTTHGKLEIHDGSGWHDVDGNPLA